MKITILLAVLTVAVADVEYIKIGNDNYDLDSLINNVPLLQAFMDCYKDVGPCSELALSYKKRIPNAVRSACSKCNPANKKLFGISLQALKQVLPHEYVIFRQIYDPENKYFDALEEELYKSTPKQS